MARALAWSCSLIIEGLMTNDLTGETKQFKVKVKDPSSYRQAVCRVASKLGDILSANRRRSWLGMPLYEDGRGQYFYYRLKELLLYGRVLHGITTNKTSGRRYAY